MNAQRRFDGGPCADDPGKARVIGAERAVSPG